MSKVAEISEVRSKLVEQQQQMGINKGVVMDGRDIGTVVFPNAELKLFINASAKKRAQRRYDELIQRGDNVTFDEILKNVEYRDHIDSTREDSPLIVADDAIEIDNSDMTLEEQFQKIYEITLKIIIKGYLSIYEFVMKFSIEGFSLQNLRLKESFFLFYSIRVVNTIHKF